METTGADELATLRRDFESGVLLFVDQVPDLEAGRQLEQDVKAAAVAATLRPRVDRRVKVGMVGAELRERFHAALAGVDIEPALAVWNR